MAIVQTSLADADALADRLVDDLRQGPLADGEILRRLAGTARPYYAWAAAWSTLQGRMAGDPDDDRTRRALAELRAVEGAVSGLERRPVDSPDGYGETTTAGREPGGRGAAS